MPSHHKATNSIVAATIDQGSRRAQTEAFTGYPSHVQRTSIVQADRKA